MTVLDDDTIDCEGASLEEARIEYETWVKETLQRSAMLKAMDWAPMAEKIRILQEDKGEVVGVREETFHIAYGGNFDDVEEELLDDISPGMLPLVVQGAKLLRIHAYFDDSLGGRTRATWFEMIEEGTDASSHA